MCEPISMGILSAATGVMGAVGQHQAQQAAVNRQNQIQQQEYTRQLQIAERNDKIKRDKHAADLKAHAIAQNDVLRQQEANQLEANRAKQAVSRQLKEKQTEVAFERQAALSQQIQASGQILATGRTGQSMLLETLATERELGFAEAQMEQSLFDANAAYGNEILGVNMKHWGADNAANNSLPPTPNAPGASFIPNKPIPAKGPSGLSLMAGIGSSVLGGVSTGMSFSNAGTSSKKDVIDSNTFDLSGSFWG